MRVDINDMILLLNIQEFRLTISYKTEATKFMLCLVSTLAVI